MDIYEELQQKYEAEVTALQHIIDGDYEKWKQNAERKFFTKKWSTIKKIKQLNGNLIINIEDEKEMMLLEKDLKIKITIQRIDHPDNDTTTIKNN
jgi:hypothetical protein